MYTLLILLSSFLYGSCQMGTLSPKIRSGSAGQVSIKSDKKSYGANEKFVFTLSNGLDQPITTLNQQTYCSIIILEKQVEADWQPVKNCISNSPSVEVTLKADSSTIVELAPSPQSLGDITAGSYRARLTYTIGEHFKPAYTYNVSSEIFSIQ